MRGLVQAVGFRPYIYKLAHQWGLRGWVNNHTEGVTIVVEGSEEAIKHFLEVLPQDKPPLSRIDSIVLTEQPLRGYQDFIIRESQEGQRLLTSVPPDVALCPDCRSDLHERKSRYYQYPFTNCTNCGPRFTIVQSLPYDRASTSMASFELCPTCHSEYKDPWNRRFHAQPIACPTCGPEVWLSDHQGKPIEGDWRQKFQEKMRAGQIVAVKSLGGFHLVCHGRHTKALEKLRQRKRRPHKPLALMARDKAVIEEICLVSLAEEKMLTGPQAPIVILEQRPSAVTKLATLPLLTGVMKTIGFMMPYTPLHELLFADDLDLLVMTSGNQAGFPLARTNEEALTQLASIVDAFLFHNRPILSRADDSVLRYIDGTWHFYRRSRGFVPDSIALPIAVQKDNRGHPVSTASQANSRTILAVGGEMKNTFALLGGDSAVLSQHIGGVHTLEGQENFLESLQHLQKLLDLEPELIVCDRHPTYHTAQLARRWSKPLLEVQHHHAHFIATLADHSVTEKSMGVILDGTGYGDDGTIWGLEIITGDYRSFQRHYTLRPLPLPGGDNAVKKPYLTAAVFLGEAFGEQGWEEAKRFFPEDAKAITRAKQMVEQKINSPLSSSAGRFFDAVSALLGICKESTYDGQAAIELGEEVTLRLGLAGREVKRAEIEEALSLGHYPFSIRKKLPRTIQKTSQDSLTKAEQNKENCSLLRYLDYTEILAGLLADIENCTDKGIIALRFHNSLALFINEAVKELAIREKLSTAALGGGVFQNPYLFTMVRHLLQAQGLRVLWPQRIPANDGGLAFGQGAIAKWQGEEGSIISKGRC
ncbi:carbamoyltransferase HypF [Heliorestis acidaminivorans]|uniref:carbamoyltransferase HypF n=1 Tax=Heliorestis acidaminivorans TaxID=553427 RepID=UPI00242D9AFC|nr:carbamoyltransferase HypF [Heliorestis acidaminivorans]